MMTDAISRLYDAYYPAGTRRRHILETHSRNVARLALELNSRLAVPLDRDTVRAAALLHDIGIFLTNAPSIDCYGDCSYIQHGTLGADLLRRHGFAEELARVAERHTGAGISPDDIREQHLPLPSDRDLMPHTSLELLICYADKFFSKSRSLDLKPAERVLRSIEVLGPAAMTRFRRMQDLFGIPEAYSHGNPE